MVKRDQLVLFGPFLGEKNVDSWSFLRKLMYTNTIKKL
nr:MAG TPA: hypothetical protein [Caudoviricetes sp.]